MKNKFTFVAAWALVTPIAVQAQSTENQALPNMIVTGGLAPIALDQFAGSLTVITAAEIEAAQATYLSDVLRRVPGFAINQSGGPGSQTQLRARGSEANHVLVLIDGVRVNDPTAADEYLFNYALLDNVERIEIIRGPQSAIWGTDALGGVINIITKTSTRNHFNFDAEVGSFNTNRLAFNGGLAKAKWQLDAGINVLDTAGTNISRSGYEEDGFENWTAHVKYGLNVSDRWDLDLSFKHADALNEFDGTDFVVSGLPTDADLWTERSQQTGQLHVAYQHSTDWRSSFAYQRTDVAADNFTFGLGITSATSAETDEYTFNSTLKLGEHDQYRVSFVADHRAIDFSQRGDASPFGDPNQDQSYHTTGLAAEIQHQVNNRFNWSVSGRNDTFNRFADVSNFKLAAAYQLQAEWRVRGSYGTGSKAPSFIERFGFFPANFIGNPNLEPEESDAFEVAVAKSWQQSRFEVVYFNQDLTNEINGFVFDPDSGLFTAANQAGDSERQGLEFDWSGQISDDLGFAVNYTHTDATEPGPTGGDVAEVRRPENMASASLDYRFAGDRGQLRAQLNYQDDQLDVFFDPSTFESSNVKLDAYTTFDVTFNWQLTDEYQVYVKGQNIFDEDYEEVLGYARPGAAYSIGLRGRF
ncbi:TonB-dependent receptor plug domain-containing protein [Marinicella meishanensis]|uniref:TonB-dependent receptor plug domain-containing protein n=1 Tax=Marinicella meishanensis TaxID=2873263 RepID=UPI001CC01E11|nr:TonB-dependent receptor [Marinicella sp. NBU2979]